MNKKYPDELRADAFRIAKKGVELLKKYDLNLETENEKLEEIAVELSMIKAKESGRDFKYHLPDQRYWVNQFKEYPNMSPKEVLNSTMESLLSKPNVDVSLERELRTLEYPIKK